jgi:hypothetical protein
VRDKPTSVVNEQIAARSRWFTGGTVFVLALLAVSALGWQPFPGIGQPAASDYPAHKILDRKFARVTFSATVDGKPVTGAVTKTCNLEIDESSLKRTGGPVWRVASTGMSIVLPGGETILVDIPNSLVCLSDEKSEIGMYDHGFWAVAIANKLLQPDVLEYYSNDSGFTDRTTGEERPGLLPVGSRIEASSILLSSEPVAEVIGEDSGSDKATEWFTRRGQSLSYGASRMIGFRAWFVDKSEWSQHPGIVSKVEGHTDPFWLDRAEFPDLPRVGPWGHSVSSAYDFSGQKTAYLLPSFWSPLVHLGDDVWQIQSKKRELDLLYRFDAWPPPRPGGADEIPLMFGIDLRLDGVVSRPSRQDTMVSSKQYSQITLFDPKSQRLILIVAGRNLQIPEK